MRASMVGLQWRPTSWFAGSTSGLLSVLGEEREVRVSLPLLKDTKFLTISPQFRLHLVIFQRPHLVIPLPWRIWPRFRVLKDQR